MDADRPELRDLARAEAQVTEAHDLIRNLLRMVSALEHDRAAPLRDFACARCVPGGDSLVPGFTCMKHRARDLVGA